MFRLALVFVAFAVAANGAGPRFKQADHRYGGYPGQPFELHLKTLLASADPRQKILWQTSTLPSWMKLNNGVLSGTTPQEMKEVAIRVQASQGQDLSHVDLYFNLGKKPQWLYPWLDLGKPVVGVPYEYSVVSHLDNPDNMAFSLKAEDLPKWLKFNSSSGLLYGTPTSKDLGRFDGIQIQLKVQKEVFLTIGYGKVLSGPEESGPPLPDPSLSAEADPKPTPPVKNPGTPVKKPQPSSAPVWLHDPVELEAASVGKEYHFDLSRFVGDVEGGTLVFRLLKGPEWMKLSPAGILSGTPLKPGDFTAVAEVSDGTSAQQAGLTGTAVEGNDPPLINESALQLTLDERATLTLNLKDPKYVIDEESDLQFSLVGAPAWATLSEQGQLTLTAKYPYVGDQRLTLSVKNSRANAQGTIRVRVIPKPRAPEWDVDLSISAQQGQPLRANLSGKVRDLDGRSLSFVRQSGPSWLGVTAAGELFGTPPTAGAQPAVVLASNGSESAKATLTLQVVAGNQPPVWSANAIALSSVRALERYQADLNKYVTEPDGETVTFTSVSGPKWAKVSDQGMITGTPRGTDVGPNAIRVRATDEQGATADATVEIQVQAPNQAPQWTEETLTLGSVQVGKPFAFDLSKKVQDAEREALTFRKVEGPGWLLVNADGGVSGSPVQTDLGNFVAVFEAFDGHQRTEVGATGKVIPRNNPPVVHPIRFSLAERKGVTLNLAQVDYVEDPDKDPLSFAMSPRSWADLSKEGKLTLRPTFNEIGRQKLDFEVTDGKDVVNGSIEIDVTRDPRPPQWTEELIRFNAKADVSFSANIADRAIDKDGMGLTFSRKMEGPVWLKVDAGGRIHGTPSDGDAGENTFVLTARNDKLEAEVALVITVSSDNTRPQWVRNPVTLPKGKAGVTYVQSLKSYVTDPDPDEQLSFKKEDGPDWLYVVSGGTVLGTPEEKDAQLNVLKVRVTDSRGASAVGNIAIDIASKNNPPRWTQATVPLGNAKVKTAYHFDLRPFAEDADGDVLIFRKVEGPSWLLVDTSGTIGGTPAATDGGEFTATFEVQDGKVAIEVNAFGRVLGGNRAPVIHEDTLVFDIGVDQNFGINLADEKYVSDPEGDKLSFKLLSALPWTSITEEGWLQLAPTSANKGNHRLSLRVTDTSGGSSEGVIRVNVSEDSRAPIWIVDPIELTATVDTTLSGDLNSYARDLSNRVIQFSKVDGPNWLGIHSSGSFSGRPTESDIGEHVIRVLASNSAGETEAKLIIQVMGAGSTDIFSMEREETQSPVELLFVLDNVEAQADYYKQLKRSAPTFFGQLDRKSVRYSVAVLSTRSFDGRPMLDSTGSPRLTSDNPKVIREFQRLVDVTRTSDTTLSSPIASMDQFFKHVKRQPDIFENGYYLPGVPLLAFVHTANADNYKAVYGSSLTTDLSAESSAKGFLSYHSGLRKPFQIYVNDFSCSTSVAQFYRQWVMPTFGQLITRSPCTPPFNDWMSMFALTVVEQAQRFQKQGFRLAQTPKDISRIKVTMRFKDTDYPLHGNTGNSSDQWHYDAKENLVILHWWNTRVPYTSTSNKLVVEY